MLEMLMFVSTGTSWELYFIRRESYAAAVCPRGRRQNPHLFLLCGCGHDKHDVPDAMPVLFFIILSPVTRSFHLRRGLSSLTG